MAFKLRDRIIVRDPILGPQAFVGKEAHLLQTAEMARLREIKQLGAGYIVYPYANHTRFHHSIGVASYVRFFISALPFDEYMALGLENRGSVETLELRGATAYGKAVTCDEELLPAAEV